jgi:Lipopolysaccharide export system permease LptF/LptG
VITLRTLDRYVLSEWLRVFFVTLLGFPILVIVIDLTDKLDTYMGRGIKPGAVALSYVFDLPEKMFLVLPVAVLFATVFTVGSLGRHSELTAAKASGISFHRLVRPLFAAAGSAFIAGLLLGEIAPVATSRRLEMLGEKAIRSTSSRYNFVYRADGGWVYAIRALELKTREMTDLMLEREGTGAAYPTIVLAAQRASYRDSAKTRLALSGGQRTRRRGRLRVRFVADAHDAGTAGGSARRTQGAGRDAVRRAAALHRRPDPQRLERQEAAGGARAQDRDSVHLSVDRAVRGAARDLQSQERRGVGRGGEPRDDVHRAVDVSAGESGRRRRRVTACARGVDAEYSRWRRGRVSAA